MTSLDAATQGIGTVARGTACSFNHHVFAQWEQIGGFLTANFQIGSAVAKLDPGIIDAHVVTTARWHSDGGFGVDKVVTRLDQGGIGVQFHAATVGCCAAGCALLAFEQDIVLQVGIKRHSSLCGTSGNQCGGNSHETDLSLHVFLQN